MRRFKIFLENHEHIALFNEEELGGASVKFAHNRFSDMTAEEFKEKILLPPR
jgi:hypothetical protein